MFKNRNNGMDSSQIHCTGWGYSNSHQFIGVSNQKITYSPVSMRYAPILTSSIPNERILEVVSGENHNIYITNSGRIYSNGTNSFGQLGCGEAFDKTNPDKFYAVQVGPNLTCRE